MVFVMAVQDEDFGEITTVLTFAVGERTKCINVSIVNDTDVEGSEMFFASLEVPSELEDKIRLRPYHTSIEIVGEDTKVMRHMCTSMYMLCIVVTL